MIQAVVFDCFGVVVTDALETIFRPLQAERPEVSVQVRDVVRACNRGLLTSRESNEQIAQLFGLSHKKYRQKIADGETKDEELLAYIAALRQTYKTAMLSNVGAGGLRRRFAPGELEQYFDVVVSSGDVGFAKPEAQAYEITADRLGVQLDECVFTDDCEPYCEAARGIGMQVILYQDFAQFRAELEQLLYGKGNERLDAAVSANP
jgi:HAD superfamily hydrolase (TIGR01509 family)